MKRHHIIAAILLSAAAAVTVACGSDDSKASREDVLVKIGSSTLTRRQLDAMMPAALNADDSVRLARAYINSWIDRTLISEIAAADIDMTNIDKMVDDYRNELIMWEYRRHMFNTHADTVIADDSLRNYYVNHSVDFVLQRPLVKGIYLKVRDDAPGLGSLRRLYRSRRSEDIDILEKSELEGAVHYDYFRDRWIDWEQIESRIPLDFGSDPDAFLRSNDHIDQSAGGFTYLLDITDYLPSGAVMPFEAARPVIASRLLNAMRRRYAQSLDRQLRDDALKKGKIELFCDLEP